MFCFDMYLVLTPISVVGGASSKVEQRLTSWVSSYSSEVRLIKMVNSMCLDKLMNIQKFHPWKFD